jgi:exodeoxyribonuclease-5
LSLFVLISFAARPQQANVAPDDFLTPHQDTALKAVAEWLKAGPGRGGIPLVFRLFGYAGTGKTTLARHIAEGAAGKVLFAALTGKAALVMRSKGCERR